MTVLVTGGAGYIGSHMVWKLLDNGEDVVVLDRLSTGFDWAVPKEAELVVGDIADQDLVEATLKRRNVDAIIHFAGSIVVPESVSDPLGYYLNNTVKSRALIESAVRPACRTSSSPRLRRSMADCMASGHRGRRDAAGVALRHLQAHDRTYAARHRRRRIPSLTPRCAISMSPAPTQMAVPASRPRVRPI